MIPPTAPTTAPTIVPIGTPESPESAAPPVLLGDELGVELDAIEADLEELLGVLDRNALDKLASPEPVGVELCNAFSGSVLFPHVLSLAAAQALLSASFFELDTQSEYQN